MKIKIIKGVINVVSTLIIIIGVLFAFIYWRGVTPYVVLSGSMEPTIETGSLCLINKRIQYEEIKENDIIAFKINDTLVTHRVITKNDTEFETKGDANEESDGFSPKENYVGKNVYWIPKLGYVVQLLQTTVGKIILGTFIILLIVSGFLFGDDNKKVKKKLK